MADLARIAKERSVVLTTRGRKSGLPRKVTIWFVVDGENLSFGTLNDERNWVRNARSNPDVELAFAGGHARGRFRDVKDPTEHAHIRALMARKYLPFRIASWFGLGQKFTFRVSDLEWGSLPHQS